MKKDRNQDRYCMPYPMPAPYPGVPMQGIPAGGAMPMQGMNMAPGMSGQNPVAPMPNQTASNTIATMLDDMQMQINNLDRRVTRLETMMNDTKGTYQGMKYNDSKYHMM